MRKRIERVEEAVVVQCRAARGPGTDAVEKIEQRDRASVEEMPCRVRRREARAPVRCQCPCCGMSSANEEAAAERRTTRKAVDPGNSVGPIRALGREPEEIFQAEHRE